MSPLLAISLALIALVALAGLLHRREHAASASAVQHLERLRGRHDALRARLDAAGRDAAALIAARPRKPVRTKPPRR